MMRCDAKKGGPLSTSRIQEHLRSDAFIISAFQHYFILHLHLHTPSVGAVGPLHISAFRQTGRGEPQDPAARHGVWILPRGLDR